MNNWKRGSQWRKWDLHIHSPASFYWTGGMKLQEMSAVEKEAEMENFIRVVNDSDVAVFCIMDYWTFDWYLELQEYLRIHPNALHKTVFPGIELRIECPVDYRLNIHCILSDKLSEQELIDFKSELTIRSIGRKLSDASLIAFAKSLDRSKARKHGFGDPAELEDAELLKLGSQTAEITKESLEKAFSQIPKDSGFVILPYDTSDGLLRLNWEEHPHDDNYFMQTADIFESRDQKNIDLISGIRTPDNDRFFENFNKTLGGKPKPCVSGSDAHRYADYGRYPSNKITWIKADPTFEGLKQIIFEPTSRIAIQEFSPENKTHYHTIDRIELHCPEIGNSVIELNENLNAIIGGRSTGKSVLLAAIAQKHSIESVIPEQRRSYGAFVREVANDIRVIWKDGREDYSRDIEYLPQGHMHELASDKEKLNALIEDILRSKGKNKVIDDFSEFCFQNKSKCSDLVNRVFQLRAKIWEKEKKFREGASIESIQQEVDRLNGAISQAGQSVVSDDDKTRYEELDAELATLRYEINGLNQELESLNELKDKNILKEELLLNISRLSETAKVSLSEAFNRIRKASREIWETSIDELVQAAQQQRRSKQDRVEAVEQDLTYTKVRDALNSSSELAQKIIELSAEKDKLNSAQEVKAEIEQLKGDMASMIIEVKKASQTYLVNAMRAALDLSIEKTGLRINARSTPNTAFLHDILQSSINLQSFANQGIAYKEIISSEELLAHVNDVFDKLVEGELSLKGGNTDQSLANRLMAECFFSIGYDLEYEGDAFSMMSDGKKAFVVLKLLLEFSDKLCPILIDQLEDDLDNRAIFEDLVKYLKEKKNVRQVIVVTHNANIVVGADSELVIVANQNGLGCVNATGKKFEYVAGSLEHFRPKDDSHPHLLLSQGIREHVCQILEGGGRAFRLREKKYSTSIVV